MPEAKPPPRTSYHHGDLRETLIHAAVQLMEKGGPDNVSMREAAKLAGVSPGAPFRHFSNKTALMTAVAEQAMSRFRSEIARAVENIVTDDPIERFGAVGVAYLRWAIRNPTHFRVISTRSLIDWEGSASLRNDNQAIGHMMEQSLLEARQRGMLRSNDLAETRIAGRALVYGLARMYIDGHFAQWAAAGQSAEQTALNALKHFVTLIRNEDPEAAMRLKAP